MTKLHELTHLGQSIWYDNIRRALIDSGELQALLDDGVMGVTSNPSIFEKAIAGSADYDEAIKALAGSTQTDEQIYESLALEDIQRTADLLRPIYNSTNGVDGFGGCFIELGDGRAGYGAGNFYDSLAPAVTLRPPAHRWHWVKVLLEKYWLWRWFVPKPGSLHAIGNKILFG